MLVVQRRERILKILAQKGQITVVSLSKELGISEDTVRRDLDDLAMEGFLRRVHGGAVPSSPAAGDFHVRESLSPAEKVRIGRRAASLVHPGQVVIVDGGTTTRELVRALPRTLKATIITHSPTIASELIDHTEIEVILLGGRLFKHSMVALGESTLNALSKINADIFFLGATGIHPEAGATTGDWEEAAVKRQMCDSATETYLLGSPEKLHAISPFQIVPASSLRGIIVLAETPPEQTVAFESQGLLVLRTEKET
jgi:DeoR/GlpR family transcriptional regulator of sugar metabolism